MVGTTEDLPLMALVDGKPAGVEFPRVLDTRLMRLCDGSSCPPIRFGGCCPMVE